MPPFCTLLQGEKAPISMPPLRVECETSGQSRCCLKERSKRKLNRRTNGVIFARDTKNNAAGSSPWPGSPRSDRSKSKTDSSNDEGATTVNDHSLLGMTGTAGAAAVVSPRKKHKTPAGEAAGAGPKKKARVEGGVRTTNGPPMRRLRN
ncbi:Hypothetical protein, putative [Bodo saltans]|uniref:Uncharacterized protein n=1 Tax=Bodo saltans TaxID=75058 RepID=A0A0S4JG84_BODSA|nr:Hypothetical protein, putative [Bodo saltans]|eukprot:CUG90479.1 Hypothetical protein, putative [Bodo saltans]